MKMRLYLILPALALVAALFAAAPARAAAVTPGLSANTANALTGGDLLIHVQDRDRRRGQRRRGQRRRANRNRAQQRRRAKRNRAQKRRRIQRRRAQRRRAQQRRRYRNRRRFHRGRSCHRRPARHRHRGYGRTVHRHVGLFCGVHRLRGYRRHLRHRDCVRFGPLYFCD